MNLVLVSLFSRKSPGAGLMIYDLDRSSPRYVQLVDFSDLPVRQRQIRGISMVGDRLYAAAPCAMLIFRTVARNKGPLLVLEKTVCRPEWILGDKQQGNLHAVYASQEQQRVYLSFNTQCAIDVFDLEGNFLQRQNLWDIAPDLFHPPQVPAKKGFRFGVVRHIFENETKEIMLITALMNGTKDSAVISYDTGRVLLNKASQPIHGGVIYEDLLYLCAIQQGQVLAFAWPQGQGTTSAEPIREFSPQITDPKWQGSHQKTRGLTVQDDRLLCGVCYLGKVKSRQIPPRMVEFDLQSGKQKKEHWLPSFKGLEGPQIYSLFPAPRELVQMVESLEGPTYYHGETAFTPSWITQDESTQETAKTPGNDGLKRTGSVTEKNEASQPDEKVKDVHAENISNHRPQPSIPKQDVKLPTDAGKETEHEAKEDDDVPGRFSSTKSHTATAVVLEDVGLCFERTERRFWSFNENMRNRKSYWALRNISFALHEGETLGVIGRNGSGKSTLSMICSGVLIPDEGKVTVHGRTHLLALGVGFKNELSGRENVFISGSLLGLKRKEIMARMDGIEEFAELGEFMDEPVRTYSSGMRSRLGFAVATAVKPDILILDEVMATGDKAFRNKAIQRIREMHSLARCVIIVSHNPGQLRKLSNRILWLENGRMLMLSEPKEVLNAYDNFSKNPAKWLRNHPDLTWNRSHREIKHDS